MAAPKTLAKDSAVAEIMRYAFQEAAAAAKSPDHEKAREFTPAKIELPEGHKLFSTVFGWVPNTLPRDIPVQVFEPSDWPEIIRPYIPDSLPNGGLWVWPKEATELLALAMFAGDRTLIHGPTGSGKSALAEAWAHMTRMPLIRVNCHRDQQSTDFLGKDIIATDAHGNSVLRYDWSLTTIAAKHGGLLLIDEAFRSPALMAIQALLERNGTLTLPDAASLTTIERKIVPPKSLRIILTDNSNGTGDESGSYNVEVQDLSTLGRITAALEVPYMSVEEQATLLATSHPSIPEATRRDLAEWAHKMREAFISKSVMQPICLRVILSICEKYAVTGSLGLAIRVAYTSKLSAADRHCASEAYTQVTGLELTR